MSEPDNFQNSAGRARGEKKAGRRADETSDERETLSQALASGWDTSPEHQLERTLSEALGGIEAELGGELYFGDIGEAEDTLVVHLQRGREPGEMPAAAPDPLELIALKMSSLGPQEQLPELAREESVAEDALLAADEAAVGDSPDAHRWAEGLRLEVAGVKESVVLGPPWARFFAELRLEAAQEIDPELRSSYIYLLAKVVQMRARVRVGQRLGVSDPSVMALAHEIEAAAAETLRPIRAALVGQVVQHWQPADAAFRVAVERLEAADSRQDASGAGRRRVSIVVERLRAGEPARGVEARLEPWLYAPETLAGLGFRGVRAHQQRAQVKAGRIWLRLARHLPAGERGVLGDAGAYFLRQSLGFIQWALERCAAQKLSRAQLLMMQRQSLGAGDLQAEASALHQLVRQDVAAGQRALQREQESGAQRSTGRRSGRGRLHALAAARFCRLSALLRRLKRAREPLPAELEALEPDQLLLDAVALRPKNHVYLRQLARRAQRRGDLETYIKALRTLARSYTDPQLAALTLTELARAVYLSGAQLKRRRMRRVERYLREALVYDSECAPARLAIRRLGLVDEALDSPYLEATLAQEQALISAQDWRGLSELLSEKLLGEADPRARAELGYRVAQLAAWHLSPVADARPRRESLARVLSDQPEHLPALLELVEVSIARAEYPAAADLLGRLAAQAATDSARAYWLMELGATLEDELGLAARAADYFERALKLHPENTAAFLGLLRSDISGEGAAKDTRVVEAIVARLSAGVAVHEAEELAVELTLRAQESVAARRALQAHFPGQPLWQFIRLCEAVEARGAGRNSSLDDEQSDDPAAMLRRMWMRPEMVELLDIVEDFGLKPRTIAPLLSVELPLSFEQNRTNQDPEMTQNVEHIRQELNEQLAGLGSSAEAEGRLIRVTHQAAQLDDPELDLLIAAVSARRSPDHLSRISELLWMALNFSWLGQDENALKTCEYILGRAPDFIPALKLAKILGVRLGRWVELTHWCEAEARQTRLDWVAFESRRLASRIQHDYLGDFNAAWQQYRLILEQDPEHPEAFDKLKTMLLKRGLFDEVLQIFEQRLSRASEAAARAELLNEMGQIALYRQHDTERARRYLMRSRECLPDQLRVLRILGELHEDQGDLRAAIGAYREAIALADNPILIERLWVGIAALAERAQDPDLALDAYRMALETNPEQLSHLLEIGRLNMARDNFNEALIYLNWLISETRDDAHSGQDELLKAALIRRAECLIKLDQSRRDVLATLSEVILNYPEAEGGVEALQDYLQARGESDRLEALMAGLSVRAFLEMKGRPFGAHFEIARRLEQRERAFNIAAVAEVLGYHSPESHEFYLSARRPRRWPSRPLPGDIFPRLLPEELSPAFVELLRSSEGGLQAALGAEARGALPPRGELEPVRLDAQEMSPALKKALTWPALFGLALGDVFIWRPNAGREEAPLGCLALRSDEAGARVNLYLAPGWKESRDPTAGLFQLGRQLAGWRLGFGRWQFLAIRPRFQAVTHAVGALASGWERPAQRAELGELRLDIFKEWVAKNGAPALAESAQRLVETLSPQAIEPQFRLVELTLERAACLLLDDLALALPHTKFLGSEHGMLQQPWTFLFGPRATKIRREIGIAL